ncbi:MAG: hypothetical protein ACYCWW_03495 [Deltaproteobacteria bacterium]
MRRRRFWQLIWIGLFSVPMGSLAGCAREEPPEVLVVRARMESDRARLADELDGIEARLEEDQNRLRLYELLAVRHRHVSVLACQNAEEHLTSMDRLARHQAEKRAALRRLAQAESTPRERETR